MDPWGHSQRSRPAIKRNPYAQPTISPTSIHENAGIMPKLHIPPSMSDPWYEPISLLETGIQFFQLTKVEHNLPHRTGRRRFHRKGDPVPLFQTCPLSLVWAERTKVRLASSIVPLPGFRSAQTGDFQRSEGLCGLLLISIITSFWSF